MPFKLIEHYTSVQGEGPRTGILTQFVRFAGCNMRCPGWPCDTQFAIDPKLYHGKTETYDVTGLLELIKAAFMRTGAMNVCFTGGEPFLQNNEDFRLVVKEIRRQSLDAEVFTNGSFPIPPWAIDLMGTIMDWKLPGSGEFETNVATRYDNAFNLNRTDAIKFVVKHQLDLDTAKQLYHDLSERGAHPLWYVGRVWDGEITDQQLVEFIMSNDLPWRLNVQIHKYIWPADARGV